MWPNSNLNVTIIRIDIRDYSIDLETDSVIKYYIWKTYSAREKNQSIYYRKPIY